MEVKPGYKQTEVGVIPNDWSVRSVGDVCGFIVPGRNKPRHFNGEIPWVTTPDLEDGRSVSASRVGLCVTRAEAHTIGSRVVPVGSVLMSCAGDLGITAITRNEIVINQQLHAFIPSPQVNAVFLLNVIASQKPQIAGLATKTAVPYLNKNNCNSILIPVPPVAEQEAIAAALSDANALIESLEQLVAKKRRLKQGAMQELLSGKKRLPGFGGEWEVVNLDGVVDRITGVWGANDSSPDYPRCTDIIRAGDISQDGLLTGSAQRFLSDLEFSKVHCRLDDIVITTSGNGLGKVWWCDGRPNVAASNFVRILRPLRGKSQGRYLSYLLRSEAGLKQLQEHTATSAYPNLRPSFFAAPWLSFPPISEQIAIADILSDMDAEIAALQAKLAKARRIKQGMMQGLLTGRIRLV